MTIMFIMIIFHEDVDDDWNDNVSVCRFQTSPNFMLCENFLTEK